MAAWVNISNRRWFNLSAADPVGHRALFAIMRQDAQSFRAQWLAEEWLAGKILVEHLASRNPGLVIALTFGYKTYIRDV